MKKKIFLFGADGRMGRAIVRVIAEADDCNIVGGFSEGEELDVPSNTDVMIDFSHASVASTAVEAAKKAGVALVAGTTGVDQEYYDTLEEAAKEIPVLHASNMSLGVNVLRHLVEEAARLLPESFDIEISEIHHRLKKDSPSGTALSLLEAANKGRGREAEAGKRLAREGMVGERPEGEIGVFGIRGGNVAGEHTVYMLGQNERVELTHRATDRDIFARGAVRAARWIADKESGRYYIGDVLGL
jgi:4-hydroxy-tetrahydrodipicolinate reductase